MFLSLTSVLHNGYQGSNGELRFWPSQQNKKENSEGKKLKYGLMRLGSVHDHHKSFYVNVSTVYTLDTWDTITRAWKKVCFFNKLGLNL